MDKVTQSNAAGAEESASAAEELNAQAQTVKMFVAELLSLVAGEGASGRTPVQVQARADSAKNTGARPAINNATSVRHGQIRNAINRNFEPSRCSSIPSKTLRQRAPTTPENNFTTFFKAG